MYNTFSEFLQGKKHISIIQAENPDGDSLGSALALDYLLKDIGVSLYCPVDIPKYLRYFEDWSRITSEFDFDTDGYIIVDTAADVLLSKLLDDPAIRARLESSPVFVLDHHETEDDLSFAHTGLVQTLPACCDLIYRIAREQNLLSDAKTYETLSAEDQAREKKACEYLYYGILSDTLGLTSASVSAETFSIISDIVSHGLNVFELDEKRRDFSKKSVRILNYKADLINRVEYFLDGSLATVHIPWEDISEYSDEYNPNVLILEELRMVEGVEIAVAIKTYPDGKVTGKLRTTIPIADKIAEYFGGGGHPYASGFRTYDLSYEDTVHELITATMSIKKADEENSHD
ncbi:DHH family phosphoesterase [Candidatus Saccharibacteria bacterium]|nr:DHH family phosphoesterase [Candidatus Saccharibacteria bacterium]